MYKTNKIDIREIISCGINVKNDLDIYGIRASFIMNEAKFEWVVARGEDMKISTCSVCSSYFISSVFSLSNQVFRSEVRYVTSRYLWTTKLNGIFILGSELLKVLVEVFGFKDFK
jgi:hypothetical protein